MMYKSLVIAPVIAACGFFAAPSQAMPLIPAGTQAQAAPFDGPSPIVRRVAHRYYKRGGHYAYRGRHWGGGYGRRWVRRGYYPRYGNCWNCGGHWHGHHHHDYYGGYYGYPYYSYGYPAYGYGYYGYGYFYPAYGYGYGFPGIGLVFHFH